MSSDVDTKRSSVDIRNQLSHPVIDADGHSLFPLQVFYDFLRDVGGPTVVRPGREGRTETSRWMSQARRPSATYLPPPRPFG